MEFKILALTSSLKILENLFNQCFEIKLLSKSLRDLVGRISFGTIYCCRTSATPLQQTVGKKMQETIPWIEKYRPKKLTDLVAHDDIISTIKKLIKAKKLPHLLFYGPPGTGKTSTILAIARELYGDNTKRMILELNASDTRGIDTVRNQIQTFAGTRSLFAASSKDIKIVV